MAEDDKDRAGWSPAERSALRKLWRMALMMLAAIVVAGVIAAYLSSVLGTV